MLVTFYSKNNQVKKDFTTVGYSTDKDLKIKTIFLELQSNKSNNNNLDFTEINNLSIVLHNKNYNFFIKNIIENYEKYNFILGVY